MLSWIVSPRTFFRRVKTRPTNDRVFFFICMDYSLKIISGINLFWIHKRKKCVRSQKITINLRLFRRRLSMSFKRPNGMTFWSSNDLWTWIKWCCVQTCDYKAQIFSNVQHNNSFHDSDKHIKRTIICVLQKSFKNWVGRARFESNEKWNSLFD